MYVRRTRGDQHAGQPLEICPKALVQMEAAALLVGREHFNAHAASIPIARILSQLEVGGFGQVSSRFRCRPQKRKLLSVGYVVTNYKRNQVPSVRSEA